MIEYLTSYVKCFSKIVVVIDYKQFVVESSVLFSLNIIQIV